MKKNREHVSSSRNIVEMPQQRSDGGMPSQNANDGFLVIFEFEYAI